jgi:hypothetical protein
MPEPTPGETAYLAYWPALGSAPPVPWDSLSPIVHRAWEAAAQAAIAQWWRDHERVICGEEEERR